MGRDTLFEKELSVGLQLEQIIHPRDNSFIRVSGISECRRKIAYRLLDNTKAPVDSHLLSIFDLGHGMHYRLQERLSNVGPLKWVDAEPTINEHGGFGWAGNIEITLASNEYKIVGHCDALTKPLLKATKVVDGEEVEVIEVNPEGKRYLIDIKTITAREKLKVDCDPESGVIRTCDTLPSSFEKLVEPKTEHIGQASMYAYLTTQERVGRLDKPLDELPDIMMIYIGKDLTPDYYENHPEEYPSDNRLLDIPYKVFTQPVNPKVVETLLKKVKGVWKDVNEGKLPPRDYHHSLHRPDFHCSGCDFRRECYSKEGYFADEDIVIPPLLKYHYARVCKDNCC